MAGPLTALVDPRYLTLPTSTRRAIIVANVPKALIRESFLKFMSTVPTFHV